MQRRPYQQHTIDTVFSEYEKGISNQLAVLSTGLGKTFIAGSIIQELPARLACAGRVLWLTHEENLIDQSAVSIMSVLFPEQAQMISLLVSEAGGIVNFMSGKHDLFGNPEAAPIAHLLKKNLGIIKQKMFDISPRIVVASVQTIYNRLDKIPADYFDLVVADEAHLFLSRTFNSSIEHFSPKIRLGLTATPERLDGLSLGDLFDKIVVDYDIKYGIDNGYLCELEAISVSTGLSLDNVRTTGGDLNAKDLKVVDCPERNNKIVAKWKEYADGRSTIVFCVDTEHAQHMTKAFIEAGVSATFVVADEKICPDRKARIRDFKAGRITVLMNVMILTAGFDYPNVSCIIPASPTKSKTRYLQQIGRGTRLKSEDTVKKYGQKCIIIDPTDNSQKHTVINTWSLENGKRIEDRIFMTSSKKAELIEKRDNRKLDHTLASDERRMLLSLPTVSLRQTAQWMRNPASEKQLLWLGSLGYDVINNQYTAGDANEIFSNLPATDGQKAYLKRFGYDVSVGCTRAQFELAKHEIDERMKKDFVSTSPLYKNSPITGIA